MEPVTSMQNTFVKYLLRLKRKRYRDRERRFLIEGIRFVEEAIDSGWPVDNLIYLPDTLESSRGARLVESAIMAGVKTLQVGKKLMDELSSTETPQGVLALCQMAESNVKEILAGREGKNTLVVIADGVSDPGNLGTIIRSADAFGADGVILTRGTVDLYNGKSLRATMGSVFHLPLVSNAEPACLSEKLLPKGVTLLVSVPAGGAPLRAADLSVPLALVVGGEAQGPPMEILSLPHEKVTIPMPGGAESLNAAVAASIMLYEAARQREKL